MDQTVLDETRPTLSRLSPRSVVFTGPLTNGLGQRVLKELGADSGELVLDRFANSETRIEMLDSVRDKRAFVLMSLNDPVNEAVMETALLVQALKLADAKKITVVAPYFAYGRQDRRSDSRPPISAKAVCDILKSMGAHQIITVDVHARQVEGFFDGPFDNLEGLQHMLPSLIANEGSELVVVSPDAGGSKRAQSVAQLVEQLTESYTPLLVMSKFRPGPGEEPRVTMPVGREFLEGKTCVLIDDMIDTGGSMIAAARALKENGAARVVIASSHGIFSQNAVERLEQAEINGSRIIDRLYVTDTVPVYCARSDFFRVVSLAPLLAEAIERLDRSEQSVSELNKRNDLGMPLRVYGRLRSDS